MTRTVDYMGKIGPAFGGVTLTLTHEGTPVVTSTHAPVGGTEATYPDYRTALDRAIFYTDN